MSSPRRSLILFRVVVVLAVGAAACSSSPAAPAVEGTSQVCAPGFCVDYPLGWEVAEIGESFVSFMHPAYDNVMATVGRVNMEGVVINAGAVWPQPPRAVVESLWQLLDGGEAELGAIDLVEGGAVDSWGFVASGRLWHRLVPISASRGIGIDIRAPSGSWEPHADVFRQSLQVFEDEV